MFLVPFCMEHLAHLGVKAYFCGCQVAVPKYKYLTRPCKGPAPPHPFSLMQEVWDRFSIFVQNTNFRFMTHDCHSIDLGAIQLPK